MAAQRFAFDDIRRVLPALPGADLAAAEAARGRGEIAAWLAAWQRRPAPGLERAGIAVFVGARTAAETGLRSRIAAMLEGRDPVHERAAALDADFRLFEMAVDAPYALPLAEADATAAIAYGMTAIADGLDIVALIGLGGAGADGAVTAALARGTEPLSALAQAGGPDSAAIFGALLAARMAGTPILAEGPAAAAALAVLGALIPGGRDAVRIIAPAAIAGLAAADALADLRGQLRPA